MITTIKTTKKADLYIIYDIKYQQWHSTVASEDSLTKLEKDKTQFFLGN